MPAARPRPSDPWTATAVMQPQRGRRRPRQVPRVGSGAGTKVQVYLRRSGKGENDNPYLPTGHYVRKTTVAIARRIRGATLLLTTATTTELRLALDTIYYSGQLGRSQTEF